MGAAVAMAVAQARKDIVRHFPQANATTPDRAVTYDPDAQGWPRQRMRHRLFARMRDFGAIREVGSGQYYLDEARLDAFRAHMRRRAFGIVAIGAAAAAAIAALV